MFCEKVDMNVKKHIVYVYYIDLDSNIMKTKQFETLLSGVSKNTLDKIKNYKYDIDRLRSVLGELLVKLCLVEEYNIKKHEIILRRSREGKPYCVNKKICFSISHKGRYVVCSATNNGRVGIDIECTHRLPNFEVARRFYTKRENTILSKLDNRERSIFFYKIWTQKESLYKMDNNMVITSYLNDDKKETRNYFRNISFEYGYLCSVCYDRMGNDFKVKEVNYDDIVRMLNVE